jgi:hypothetical protein
MRGNRIPTAFGSTLGAFAGILVLAAFQPSANIQYQGRGHYREGTRTAPSTYAANLVLISALIDYDEAYTTLPPEFCAGFYLPRELKSSEPVYLTIRETKPAYFYWLDDVKPPGGWRPGEMNRFPWRTGTVIRHLNYRKEDGPLRLGQLAATARLGRPTPANLERVAPVALYHSRPPQVTEGYRFVFLPEKKMRLTFQVFKDGAGAVSSPQPFPSVPGGLPKEVRFDAKSWQDACYYLSVTGYSEDGRVEGKVHFYHAHRLGQ